jgi:Holliday junction resolvase
VKESELQRMIVQVLRAHGMVAWLTHDSRHPPVQRGISDINAILPGGRFLAIECKQEEYSKAHKERREVQDAWLDEVRRGGGVACVAQSLDDILALKPWKVD